MTTETPTLTRWPSILPLATLCWTSSWQTRPWWPRRRTPAVPGPRRRTLGPTAPSARSGSRRGNTLPDTSRTNSCCMCRLYLTSTNVLSVTIEETRQKHWEFTSHWCTECLTRKLNHICMLLHFSHKKIFDYLSDSLRMRNFSTRNVLSTSRSPRSSSLDHSVPFAT